MKKILSSLLLVLVSSSAFAAGVPLAAVSTAFPNADATTNFGIFNSIENLNTDIRTNMLNTVIVPNNVATTYNVPVSTAYVIFSGTQTASAVTVFLPPATTAVDGQTVTVLTAAAAVSGITVSSVGATIVSPTITWTSAGAYAMYKYVQSLATWFVVGF